MRVKVERAQERDLPLMADMERASGTSEFIIPCSLEEHLEKYRDPNVVYLRIVADGKLAGFVMLAKDADALSIEFRRIVVASKGRGIGQKAILAMEAYCRDQMQRTRIWLDVFEHNARGRHVYEKLGYQRFARSELDGEPLLLYEKQV